MDSQQVLNMLPNIKGSAAKLLIHRMFTHGAFKSDAEIMRETGVTDRATYYAAKAKLRHLGWWENPTSEGRETLLPQVGNSDQVGKPDLQVVGKPDQPSREILPGSRETRLVGKPDQVGNSNHLPRIIAATLDATVIKAEEPDLREEAMQLDLLPGDGDPRTPSSNYSKKRRDQVAFLQRAWKHYFPKSAPLQAFNAKRMLSLTEESTEDILDQFEVVQARGIESPLAYLMKVFESNKAKMVASQPQIKSVAIGKPERDEDSGISYMMDKPSAKTLAIEARARAMGRLKSEDDDE